MKHLGKNAVIATALVAAGFFAAWLRFRPYLEHGGEYTNGVETFDTDDEGSVRYAVWDAPAFLPGAINQNSAESRPALSSDGRWLAFAVGERGLNVELYVAEMVDGVPRDARPLAALDTPADECAPAFAGDTLYFASDRPGGAGGLDVYRADFRDGRCGTPERLTGAINSSADDTDPTPRPGTDALVFATDRGGGAGFELYESTPNEAGERSARPLTPLNTRADEREGSFTADGHTLFFASNRDGGSGGFDLYRSTRNEAAGVEGWSAPCALAGLNTTASERAPLAAFDDFSLYFAREAPERGLDLARARSIELFRSAGDPVGWKELLVLAALLVAALLAWLAKRWPKLETLYKCYLASLITHLILLWFLQSLFVDPAVWKRAKNGDGFKVKIEASARKPSLASRERAGELEATGRSQPVANELVRHDASVAELDASERPLAAPEIALPTPTALAAPQRGDVEVARAPATAPNLAVAAPSDALERRRGEAREFALAVRSTETARSTATDASPARGELHADEGATDAPVVATRVDGPVRADVPRPSKTALARTELEGSTSEPSVELAAPHEALAKRSGAVAADLGLDAVAEVSGPRAPTTAAPERGEFARAGTPTEATPGTASEMTLSPRAQENGAPVARNELDLAPKVASESAVALRTAPPAERRSVATASAAQSDLLDGFAAPDSSAREHATPNELPQRLELSGGDSRTEPEPAALATLDAPPARSSEEPPRPTKSLDETPFKNRSGAEKSRALELYGGTRETEAAVSKGLAYLARIQRPGGEWGDADVRDDKYGAVAVGKTGLALLAFLGAGHTQSSKSEYSENVGRALEFLLATQDEATGHFGESDAYGHGIATYALSECYALSVEPQLVEPLRRAVAHILANQNRQRDPRLFGGWSYYYADGHVYDRWPRTAITVWQVMALESARLAGLEVPRKVFDDARTFLENARDPDNDWYRYNHDPSRLNSGWPTLPASTPAALFALALFGEDLNAAKYDDPRRFVLERAPREYRRGSDDDFVLRGQGNLYFWYYGTLAMFRAGGSAWQRWNASMKDALVRGQRPDGSWIPIDVYANYARDDDHDRSYSTAMCVLSLEVYYRYYLPLLQVR
ncbi:MAG: hypothetical protein K8S98_03465 [Planctomycetes bacterium]|nr:hypothetical protein [Planctomycetota bacterium]